LPARFLVFCFFLILQSFSVNLAAATTDDDQKVNETEPFQFFNLKMVGT
jgi:hypothetical protein